VPRRTSRTAALVDKRADKKPDRIPSYSYVAWLAEIMESKD
jgi:hypothetical protein